MKIERFEDLECWKEARILVNMVYDAINSSEKFRKDYRVRDQITDAAVSSMSNIAEGFSRHSNREFIQYLALGTKLWVEKASGKIYLLTNDLRSFDKEASAGCTTIISQVYWEFKGFMSQQLKPCSEKKASQSS